MGRSLIQCNETGQMQLLWCHTLYSGLLRRIWLLQITDISIRLVPDESSRHKEGGVSLPDPIVGIVTAITVQANETKRRTHGEHGLVDLRTLSCWTLAINSNRAERSDAVRH